MSMVESNLRNTAPVKRKSVIRRLYGPENAHVRKNVRLLEEKPQRSQTAFLGDPNHKVPYENHPYEKDQDGKRRNLQVATFSPIRIRFETGALDDRRNATNAAKIDFIKNEILPRTADFWSAALSVVPVSGNLKISSAELDNLEFCGDSEFTKVPAEHMSTGVTDTDLLLYVSGAPSSIYC